jgi:ankyrin repeat protein
MRSWDGFARSPAENDLFTYARQGNVEGLRRIVSGATVNARDERGHTPLIIAAYNGFAEMAELLLELGADPNLQNQAGDSALMGAAFRGHLAIVLMLLRFGANAELQNAKGLSALGIATLFGRTEVAYFLSTPPAARVA